MGRKKFYIVWLPGPEVKLRGGVVLFDNEVEARQLANFFGNHMDRCLSSVQEVELYVNGVSEVLLELLHKANQG